MSEQLNWHDLEILHAVLETGSFSGAARDLNLSQPTVSRHIDALERKLGKELFARAHGALQPSKLALDLGDHAAGMNEGMFAIRRVLDGVEEKPQGIVTINLPHGIGGIPVARSLEDFHHQFPDITVDLKFGPPQNNLGRREADIDVRLAEPAEPELICRCVGAVYFGLYATPEYLEQHGVPQKPEELNHHAFPEADDFLMGPVKKSLAEFGTEPQHFPFRCSGNTMLVQVLAYMGITLGLIPIGMGPAFMQRLFPDYRWEAPPLWLTMHSGLRRNAAIRAVWNWLVEQLPLVTARTRGEHQAPDNEHA